MLAPGTAARVWLGESAPDGRMKVAVRGLGARDLALGVGPLRALERGDSVQGWVLAAAIGDLADGVSGVLGAKRLGASRALGTIVSGFGAAAIGLSIAGRVDEG